MQMPSGQFDGLAGPDQQGGLIRKLAEYLSRQTDSRESHRDGTAADGGIRAHLFCHGEGVLEQSAQ